MYGNFLIISLSSGLKMLIIGMIHNLFIYFLFGVTIGNFISSFR